MPRTPPQSRTPDEMLGAWRNQTDFSVERDVCRRYDAGESLRKIARRHRLRVEECAIIVEEFEKFLDMG